MQWELLLALEWFYSHLCYWDILKKNSRKVANCQMAHEDNDRLKNIFYLLILDTDSFQNFWDLRINARSPNTQPYCAPAVKPCVPDEGAVIGRELLVP